MKIYTHLEWLMAIWYVNDGRELKTFLHISHAWIFFFRRRFFFPRVSDNFVDVYKWNKRIY